MRVRIVELEDGLDPDEYCKERGADAYRGKLDKAQTYFYWLADRARAKFDLRTAEGVWPASSSCCGHSATAGQD